MSASLICHNDMTGFLKFIICQNWFSIKSEWQNNSEIPALCTYFIIHWQVTSLYSFPHFWCSSSWRHCWCWKGRGHSSCGRPWTWGRRDHRISIRSWPLGRPATRLCWTSILKYRNFMGLVIDKTKLSLPPNKCIAVTKNTVL